MEREVTIFIEKEEINYYEEVEEGKAERKAFDFEKLCELNYILASYAKVKGH